MPNTPASPSQQTSQLTLSLFDSTALSGGLTLDGAMGGGLRYREPEGDDADDAPSAPAPERIPARNWRLSGDRALARGWKARAADNLQAIRLALAITREGRHATADEQEVLSRFVGFGASELANAVFRRPGEAFRSGWEDLGTELEQLVTPEQMAGLARATQYAHFTPEYIVRAIWGAVTRMGFAGGTVLEPGCGTGLFLALMPEALMGKTAATAVEMDPCTTVRADDPAGKLGLSLHDYFIARSIERLKPGGLAAFVTSRFTMDKMDETARGHIAGMADLLGAVRLPQGSMLAVSGTEVVVDVLFFQKRAPGTAPNGTAWDSVAEAVPAEDGEPAIYVNRYFTDNPVMVLGTHGRTSGPFGPVYTCRGSTEGNLRITLESVLARCPEGIHTPPDAPVACRPEAARIQVGTAAEGATVKEGSFLVLDGHLVQVVDGAPVPVPVRSGAGGEGIPLALK